MDAEMIVKEIFAVYDSAGNRQSWHSTLVMAEANANKTDEIVRFVNSAELDTWRNRAIVAISALPGEMLVGDLRDAITEIEKKDAAQAATIAELQRALHEAITETANRGYHIASLTARAESAERELAEIRGRYNMQHSVLSEVHGFIGSRFLHERASGRVRPDADVEGLWSRICHVLAGDYVQRAVEAERAALGTSQASSWETK